MASASIRVISDSFVKPKYAVDGSEKPFYLGSSELTLLSQCYSQSGLLFNKLPSKEGGGMNSFIERLKQSLSSTLAHFYPIAGQLVTEVDDEKHESLIYVDCTKGPGVRFIHAAFDEMVTVNEISSTLVPVTLKSCFELGRISTNYDGHDQPLLEIQVTELVDGIFLGVSKNHIMMDGTSYWNFLSSWSEMYNDATKMTISRLPICERWFPEGYRPILKIPYTHPNEFIRRHQMVHDNDIVDPLSEVVLDISSNLLATLKAKANADCGVINKITSIQALCALLWRSVVRSTRKKNNEDDTSCFLICNDRSRVRPPLAPEYLGNFIHPIIKSIKVGELLANNMGWVALLLNQGVEEVTHELVCDKFVNWIKSPFIPALDKPTPNSIVVGGIPRANLDDIQFGLGKAIAIRNGSDKYDGKVVLNTGVEKGSISLQICLSLEKMAAFQEDDEVKSFLVNV